jgi:nudix-type nucleoside diphosphatase (YffH/AdpP family)
MVEILETNVLSDKKYPLKEITFRHNYGRGAGTIQKREVYERRNSATVLLYNAGEKKVILTRQLRLPTFLNGNSTGMMTECCAGIIDEGETPEACIRREALEETGYRLGEVVKVFEAFMSPASVTELIHFYTAPYHAGMKETSGGGMEEEQEHIEVLELPFEKAFAMIASGDIRDAKTIMLLQYLKLQGLL